MAALVAGALVGLIWLAPDAALAQTRQTARIVATPPTIDVTLAGGVMQGAALGSLDANIRANATTLNDYRLFSTATRVKPAPVFDVKVGVAVTSRLSAEGQIGVGKPQVETTIDNDVEGAPSAVASERLTQFQFGGGVRVRLSAPGALTVPFVTAGAGILRQIHEDKASHVHSPFISVGGGIQRALGAPRGGAARQGLRLDVQLLMVRNALLADKTVTPQVAVTGGVFFAF